jgi:hypothetical protein
MIVDIIEVDGRKMYRSKAVYTEVNGVRTLVSAGVVGDTLEQVVNRVQQLECQFTT